jgi:hypothetical protein
MRYRLRTLLTLCLLIVAWASTLAIGIAVWGRETWEYFAFALSGR